MSTESPRDQLPLGLLELDSEGTILYYRPERDGDAKGPRQGIVGRNFFTDVVRARNSKEFQERLGDFRLGREPARSFDFTFSFEQAYVSVRVLVARMREQSVDGSRESVFIHIRDA